MAQVGTMVLPCSPKQGVPLAWGDGSGGRGAVFQSASHLFTLLPPDSQLPQAVCGSEPAGRVPAALGPVDCFLLSNRKEICATQSTSLLASASSALAFVFHIFQTDFLVYS